jgi:glycosyltransferase involved in cell wall biosynthesis
MDNTTKVALPRVSVVIPAYNEEKYLPQALSSLRQQSHKDFELLVVDNNSTDATKDIARKFGATVITEDRQGYVYALSRGLREAKGDVVAVMDADTRAFPSWVATIQKLFVDQEVVAATGAIRTSQLFSLGHFLIDGLYSLFLLLNFCIGKPHLSGFNFAVRREALEKAGGMNVQFTMSPDVDLGLRMKQYGKVVYAHSMVVLCSTRRFEGNALNTFLDYAKGYWYAVWLRKPPPVRQVAVR